MLDIEMGVAPPISIITSNYPLIWESKVFHLPPQAENHELVFVDVARLRQCYTPRNLEPGQRWLAPNEYIEAPMGTISKEGYCSILRGQTQFDVLASLGNRIIPLALTKNSIENARRWKIVRKLSYPRYVKSLGGIMLFRFGARGWSGLKVLMLKDDRGKWSIPKGHVEKGETLLEGAIRECVEETGIYAEVDLDTYLDVPTNTKVFRIYLGYTDKKQVKLSHEHTKSKWMAPEEAIGKLTFPQMAHAIQVLTDSISFAVNPEPQDTDMLWAGYINYFK